MISIVVQHAKLIWTDFFNLLSMNNKAKNIGKLGEHISIFIGGPAVMAGKQALRPNESTTTINHPLTQVLYYHTF